MSTPARVLVVDDHPLVRTGLVALFERGADFEVCADVGGVQEALLAVKEFEPNLVILDLSLGDGSGLELIRHISRHYPQIRVLVSSMHDDVVYAERCVQLGAMGYINKSEAAETIIDASRRVLAGEYYVHPRVSQTLIARVKRGGDQQASPMELLTNRELEVLRMLGEGLSVREISARLSLSPKTIETYRERLKQKLDIKSSARLLHFAVQWTLESAAGADSLPPQK